MKVQGRPMRTIWLGPDGCTIEIIDQTRLPHELAIVPLEELEDAARAISTMQVRGAPLIGATAAYGVALAIAEDSSDAGLDAAISRLAGTRPTAVNLRWALAEMKRTLLEVPEHDRHAAALVRAGEIAEEDVAINRAIGEHGAGLIAEAWRRKGLAGRIDILTHCNAGWLATVDWGTALAPIYRAYDDGIPIHVWVDETRPRNQGAALTAFELGQEGIKHTVIVDNAGGHLMQHGRVDLCLVGADRLTRTGDAANKIGTYLKALAAGDNGVPFYVCAPASTIDWRLTDGVTQIPIEERDPAEVTHLAGQPIAAPGSSAANFGFDVTPARLITGVVTERGVCRPDSLASLFPEQAAA